MSRAKPTLGYPSRTAAVMGLRAQRFTTRQIADRIGIAEATVAALEHSAARAKRPKRPAEAQGRTVLFPVDVLDRLREPAAARGISANELARRIVEAAVDDSMIDAILDDRSDHDG